MGRHSATPTRRTRTLLGAGLAAGALTLTGTGTAWAGDRDDEPTTICGAMEPGDADIAAPVCAPVQVNPYIAPVVNLELDDLGDDLTDPVGGLLADLL